MEWLLNIIYYIVPFLILLGVLVFVHEFGHFIIARKLDVSVSAFSIGFVKLILIYSLFESINGPLWLAVQATGKIKRYQII